jgi:hypothetical protein
LPKVALTTSPELQGVRGRFEKGGAGREASWSWHVWPATIIVFTGRQRDGDGFGEGVVVVVVVNRELMRCVAARRGWSKGLLIPEPVLTTELFRVSVTEVFLRESGVIEETSGPLMTRPARRESAT